MVFYWTGYALGLALMTAPLAVVLLLLLAPGIRRRFLRDALGGLASVCVMILRPVAGRGRPDYGRIADLERELRGSA